MGRESERFRYHGTLDFSTVELFGIIHEFRTLSRFYRDNEVFVEFRAEFESPITIMPQIGRQSIDDQSVGQILNTR